MEQQLSLNHQRFIDEYFKHGNATRAYEIVFGCDYESANASASRLLVNVSVQTAIQKKFAALRSRNEIEIDTIISKLKKLIDECEADADRKNLLKAVDQLSKIMGAYVPEKIAPTNQTPIQINIIAPGSTPSGSSSGPIIYPDIT